MQPWFDAYLHDLRVIKRLAERTIHLYARDLQQLQSLCEAAQIRLTDVQHSHIRHWLATCHSAGRARSTMALQLSTWRGLYKWLIANHHAQHNPCANVRPPKAAKPLPKALGVDAAMAMAEFRPAASANPAPTAQEPLNQLLVELLYGCGLRVSELVGLDMRASQAAMDGGRGWIDTESSEVHVFGKGSKRRMVPLGRKASAALAHYVEARSAQLASLGKADSPEPALLLGPKGNRLTRQAVWSLLRARSLEAGSDTPIHPHMLRHSFASHMLQSSGDLRAVQELLGHSSIASTQVYTKLDFQHLAKIYDNTHPRAKLGDTTQRTTL